MYSSNKTRELGGLAQLLPFTFGMMLLGSLFLAGFPLMGFYANNSFWNQVSLNGPFRRLLLLGSAPFVHVWLFAVVYGDKKM